MTVQELIDELSKIENKELPVYVEDYEHAIDGIPGLDFPKVHDGCYIEFEEDEIEFVLLSSKDFAPVME